LQLEAAGIIARSSRNKWPAIETLSKLVLYYRDEARRGHRSAADAELRKARAAEIRLRTALRCHDLIEQAEALAICEEQAGIMLTALSALPARVTRDLQMRREIEAVIDDLRRQMAERMRAHAAALWRTGEAAPPYEHTDADAA
jgi:hypothetical protein